jgi:hypothetical protein
MFRLDIFTQKFEDFLVVVRYRYDSAVSRHLSNFGAPWLLITERHGLLHLSYYAGAETFALYDVFPKNTSQINLLISLCDL